MDYFSGLLVSFPALSSIAPNNPISKQVEKFIETKDLEILKNLWVQNIIFQDKCWYFEKYLFLEELDWLKKVFDKKYLKIYKIKNKKK